MARPSPPPWPSRRSSTGPGSISQILTGLKLFYHQTSAGENLYAGGGITAGEVGIGGRKSVMPCPRCGWGQDHSRSEKTIGDRDKIMAGQQRTIAELKRNIAIYIMILPKMTLSPSFLLCFLLTVSCVGWVMVVMKGYSMIIHVTSLTRFHTHHWSPSACQHISCKMIRDRWV